MKRDKKKYSQRAFHFLCAKKKVSKLVEKRQSNGRCAIQFFFIKFFVVVDRIVNLHTVSTL